MFYDEILKIGNFILGSFRHIWPYLLVTIPLAVAIQMSGTSKYIKRAFAAKPFSAISLNPIRTYWCTTRSTTCGRSIARSPVSC